MILRNLLTNRKTFLLGAVKNIYQESHSHNTVKNLLATDVFLTTSKYTQLFFLGFKRTRNQLLW